MSTLLPYENRALSSELDNLGAVVDAHVHVLRNGSGPRATLNGFRFILLKRDRNTLYRVRGAHEWYLKLPRDHTSGAVVRERLGLAAITRIGEHASHYMRPAGIRTNVDLGYVLCARIGGKPLNHCFYQAALAPIGRRRRLVRESFEALGSTLAALHSQPLAAEMPESNRSLAATVSRWTTGTSDRDDDVTRAIRRWAALHPLPPSTSEFVHGNFSMNNVLACSGQISVVDFENCGSGSIYDDVSALVSQLALMHCLVWFPKQFVTDAESGLMDAYCRLRPLDREALHWALTARLAQYYLTQVTLRKGVPRIAGIPLAIGRLRRMLQEALSGAFSPVVD